MRYTAAAMAHQYIFTMQNLRRVHPPNKEVLKGIYLSFYPGAKIGVLGSNGAGKSTLLRIMAGVDKDFFGEAKPADGIAHRLPAAGAASSTRRKDVLGNVEEAVASTQGAAQALRRGEPEARRGPEARRDGQAARGAGQAAGRDRGGQRLGARPHARDRDGRAAPAAGRRRRDQALRRRAAPRRAVPDRCCERPDLLLLDEPTNHLDAESVAWLEHHLHEYPGTVVAVTHDRYFLDNVAGWILELDRGAGIPWEGNYSSWLEQKQKRLERGGEGRVGAPAHARARAGVGARVAARAAGQAQGAPRGLRGAAGRGAAEARGHRSRSASRPGRAWATWWSRPSTCARPTATSC